MQKAFTEVNIERFRGIKDLSLKGLKRINVLLGDNNSGKTSVLEVLRILGNPVFTNFIQVCNQRTRRNVFNSYFSDLLYAFPRDVKNLLMHFSCVYDSTLNVDIKLTGKIEKTFSIDALLENNKNAELARTLLQNKKSIDQFLGKLILSYENKKEIEDVLLTPLDILLNRLDFKRTRKFSNIVYLDSLNSSDFNHNLLNINRNEKYKEVCINMLRLFDDSIDDIVLLWDDFQTPTECIKSRKFGTMPVNNYVYVVIKLLSIAEALSLAHGGVLLIDEFETGIHSKNFNDIFNFLIKASRTYKIQLFVTTHSIEAIDELLKIDGATESDDIRFITLRKDPQSEKTLSRILTPKEVKENRDSFGFEVRL